MATFRVAFDGKWQEDFEELADAVEWAREVSLTGRVTMVVERRALVHLFRAGFPEERSEEIRESWNYWRRRGLGSGIM